MKFHCFYPDYKSTKGHEHQFVNILYEYSLKNNLEFILYCNSKNKINSNFLKKKVFFTKEYKGLINKIYNLISFIIISITILRKLKKDQDGILFIDYTSEIKILLTSLIIRILNLSKLKILIYVRLKTNKNIILKIFKSLLFKNQFNFLTDSINLQKYFNNNRSYKFYLMPIPHLPKIQRTISREKYILIPGKIRKDKGIRNIISIFHYFENLNFPIYVDQSIDNYIDHKKFKNVFYLPKELNNDEFYKYINDAYLILLPYQSKSYEYRTSGIFYESIALKKIVIVGKYTSMASEYNNFQLEDIIVSDWSKINIDNILKNYQFYNNEIKKLRMTILKFHNKKRYFEILKKIL